jgi:ribose transport system ATP-binding protein
LSGGNQQKVVIARSLCCKSSIFLFDEPTQGVDVGAKVEIYHLLNDIVRRGAAVLIASSELPELLGMCDRILAMYRGEIIEEFKAKETSQEEILRAIFGKKAQPARGNN